MLPGTTMSMPPEEAVRRWAGKYAHHCHAGYFMNIADCRARDIPLRCYILHDGDYRASLAYSNFEFSSAGTRALKLQKAVSAGHRRHGRRRRRLFARGFHEPLFSLLSHGGRRRR